MLKQIHQLLEAEHYDPHALLGLHPIGGGKVIRLWRPGAEVVHIELFGKIISLKCTHEAGLFECEVPEHTSLNDYRIYHQNGLLAADPYAFTPTFGEVDQHLFGKGVHYELYKVMGARLAIHKGHAGVKFSVWAPGAKRVSIIGDFNFWDGRINPMRSMGGSGIWELFVPGLSEGHRYKFEIKTQNNGLTIKADPYALSSEMRPATASVVANIENFYWSDAAWMRKRSEMMHQSKPMNIYELHLGSWKQREGGGFLNYREIAQDLARYCKEMGYTHVELLPVAEHPLDESWGYQVTGYYAVTSRFGTPQDFQYFVDHLHNEGIGVLLDWVPAHFPTDDFSLSRFDGTALYEHADPRQGFHPHWNTYIFNYGRHEVSNFLIANALFWFEIMHIDGLRVDAVASMLYLDYGREKGEWIPNRYGGKENLEAIEFIKHLNSIVHSRVPGAVMIAEESTSFPKVSHPVEDGGLGFDFKWNMGWMNDTLSYFSRDPFYRCYHQNELTFGLLYAFSEKFISVLSHDEVVHGKKSLLSKMPGDMWQKFANLRLLISYMMCQPGKKLLFMGGEIGVWNEWYCKASLEWHLLQYKTHKGLHTMVKELNQFYLNCPALWEKDFNYTGFEWIDFHDVKNCIISYLRKGSSSYLLCVHNFTPTFHREYTLYIHNVSQAREVFNTDNQRYDGSGKINEQVEVLKGHQGESYGLKVTIAPLSTSIFEIQWE